MQLPLPEQPAMHPPSVKFTLQSFPPQPVSQTQDPLLHEPWLLQLFEQPWDPAEI
jgi:hypothetical protein